MKDILVIGAGAIGRGYLPWIFDEKKFRFVFVDVNAKIIDEMKKRGEYATHRVRGGKLERKSVKVAGAFTADEFKLSRVDPAAIFVSVGPRNCASVAKLIEGAACPVIMCENDPATVDLVKRLTGLGEVVFAIPDVITSNSAPAHLRQNDPLAVVTEDGTIFVDAAVKSRLEGQITFGDAAEISRQWRAKLFLHNTPHCVAAYLGSLMGVTYVHEAMRFPEVNRIVEGAMTEMLDCLKSMWEIPHDFLEWYAEKELARFRNELLFDPIARVAREPLRKLEPDGRLLGAAQLCLAEGLVPNNILLGIASAMLFDQPNDSDRHLSFLRQALPTSALLTHILGLRKGEALEVVLRHRFDSLLGRLTKLSRERAVTP